MFRRIRNSWELVKASAGVLRADKELVVFPILSAIVMVIVTASFFVPAILAGLIDSVLMGEAQVAGAVVAFLFYLVQYFVIFFTNSALVGAALIRLRGGDPTVGDGIRIALRHSGAILGYALIAATVGMILRWLSERAGAIGRIVVGLVGLAWNIATYLVVPVLVMEEVGPVDGIKRSVELLKRTWGEQIVGDVSIGLIFGLLSLLAILAGIPVIVLAANMESVGLILGVIAIEIVILLLLGLINSTLSGIYTAAVYQYAVTGETGGYLEPEMVRHAFRHKA
ncbi:MAG: hypothetical protein JXA93_08015 [Anaerolineae bacterium]|nr:hypothetical protein [Anaerolineae bacterium]